MISGGLKPSFLRLLMKGLANACKPAKNCCYTYLEIRVSDTGPARVVGRACLKTALQTLQPDFPGGILPH